MTRSINTLALAATLAVLAQPALAARDEVVTRHITVSYADLNLQADAGARALLRRLHAAATVACGKVRTYNPAVPQQPAIFRACRDEALKTAVAKVDQPTVSAAYREYVSEAVLPSLASR